MVTLAEVASAWSSLNYGHVKRGNNYWDDMQYFLSCTKKFNHRYHIHLLTFDNGKAKLRSNETHTDLMDNIFNEPNAVDVAIQLYNRAGYQNNKFCNKSLGNKYLKYKILSKQNPSNQEYYYKLKYYKYKLKYLDLAQKL